MSSSPDELATQNIDDVRARFVDLFGVHGGDVIPGNFGTSRTVVSVCRQLMTIEQPILYDYFVDWDDRDLDHNPLSIERTLLQIGQWEGAWALAQLHYDQLLKQEVLSGQRLHKGHPLCGLAILGRDLGSPALERHYGQLSSAGDIYWEHEIPELRFGGYAPTMLERYEAATSQDLWRQRLRGLLGTPDPLEPLYLEAFLAGRWFTETYAAHIYGLASLTGHTGRSFADVLLESVEHSESPVSTVIGTRFEAVAGLLLSATPGFEVRSGRRTTKEQIDLVVNYSPDLLSRLRIAAGPGLVECKSSSREPVSVSELRDFGTKCVFHHVSYGILVAHVGISGNGRRRFTDPEFAELVRRQFLADGLTLLVLDIDDLRGKSRELRGLQDALAADHDRLVFGPIAGES